MAFFSKNNDSQENKPPRNPSNVIMFRLLAIAYVGYLVIQMIKLYIEGGPDAPSLPMLIIGAGLLSAGVIWLAIISYKEWKRNKPIYEEAMAEIRAKAEAARAEEEAALAAAENEDEDDIPLLPEEAELQPEEPENT